MLPVYICWHVHGWRRRPNAVVLVCRSPLLREYYTAPTPVSPAAPVPPRRSSSPVNPLRASPRITPVLPLPPKPAALPPVARGRSGELDLNVTVQDFHAFCRGGHDADRSLGHACACVPILHPQLENGSLLDSLCESGAAAAGNAHFHLERHFCRP